MPPLPEFGMLISTRLVSKSRRQEPAPSYEGSTKVSSAPLSAASSHHNFCNRSWTAWISVGNNITSIYLFSRERNRKTALQSVNAIPKGKWRVYRLKIKDAKHGKLHSRVVGCIKMVLVESMCCFEQYFGSAVGWFDKFKNKEQYFLPFYHFIALYSQYQL